MLTDTLPTNWSYVSEGGESIVFSYKGPDNPLYTGTVLRLRKCSLTNRNPPNAEAVVFHEEIMARLIDPTFLPKIQHVHVGQGAELWLNALAALCEPQRPLERKRTDRIDSRCQNAALATDLVGCEALTIEIKPKWGFLPSPTHLSEATQPIKTRTCRFCMHSHLKAQPSSFCPLDLYSGEECRIKKALEGLWEVWLDSDGAINNFRVFVHGKRISSEESSSISKEATISALLGILTTSPVLRTLSRLQRTLDALDIEGLATLWNAADVGGNPTVSEWHEFITSYLSSPNAPPPATPEHLRYHVLAYLLSATFKDCSIIVGIASRTVTVIDLALKSIDRLSKWEQLDREILSAYAAVPVQDRKICVDAAI
ncbi:inositol-pentakisphosphate 2-kinase [Roridomyces roridus]|uniref:Inositol-pentakisphosphate 2-kinase n=1 Tax=Roridomyces roridus TaxID=1738132 RepID=A0AAD7BYN9_9AGAR|nr:inositol-pentakisphosphate 2-kinase [Roridomyces roridus]